jgi:hypothetical protein
MRSPAPRALTAVLVLLALSACDAPNAPVQRDDAPSFAVAGPSGTTYVATGKVLHRTRWVNYDVTDSLVLRPDRSGTLQIRSAGLMVKFPKGAVAQTTTLWVTAKGGNKVVYEFGPHGTQFLVPITIQQDLRDTKAYQTQSIASDLFGGYTPAGTDDIASDGSVKVSEVLGVNVVPEQHKARWAFFYPTHFSGYVLASGRASYNY